MYALGAYTVVVCIVLTYVSHVDAAALCDGYTGTVLGGDCKEQWCPHPLNNVEYPKWPYCGRKPNDPDTKYAWMTEIIPPQDKPYHTCGAGRVLRHDAAGLVCRIYNDDWSAGECFDGECCTGGVCTDITCGDGWTLRSDAAEVSCYFGCDQQTCCEEPTVKKVPGQNAVGMLFNDKDPERYEFGGKATILRAIDESDITHYRVYWGFAMVTRKAPSCILRQPVGWETWKWMDSSKLFKEFPKTGCDIQFEIPMNTKAQDWALCDISYDRKDIFTSATDKCNPHYLMVVSVNENGEKPVTRHQSDHIGPVLAISDYEAELGYACAESGLVGGQDLINIDDAPLGVQGDCPSAAECAKRCREYSGEKGPCRIFTWAYPTGGPNSNTCWMESQAIHKVHYTVRVSGPAVCPSADEATAPPTGLERPKCTRWRRYQNKVTFTPGQQWGVYTEGINYIERPLGQFQNFETCKSICDMDVLCIGFYWQKSLLWNAGDLRLLKMCRMMRIDSGERNELLEVGSMSVRNMDNLFDTWLCTRATMAPMVIGYVFKANPFGYHTCGAQTATSQKVVASVDCCATACDEDANCKAFTFWNKEKRCDLFAACSIAKVDKVAGCAYESCFDGYGASTYMKETTRTIEIVDRFPRQGTKDGIPINVQTNGMMEGAEVVCGVRYLDDTRDELPESAEQMKADASLKDVVKSAFVVNDVASMVLTQEKAGALKDGLNYKVRCAVVDRAKYAGLPAYIDTPQSFQLQEPKGYQFVRHGRCIGYKECAPTTDKGRGVSYDDCLAFSNAGAEFTGFSWGFSDGWCRLYTVCPPNGVAKNDMNYYCWKKTDEWELLNDPGKGVCDQVCPVGDTCHMSRTMGVCDRNIYIPPRETCADVLDECAGTNPCGDQQKCADPNTAGSSLKDYTCTCISDPVTVKTGEPAVCTLDECLQKPCGADQTCTDPDQKFSATSGYVCACINDPTKTQIAAQPTCPKDECSGTNPCGDQQNCADPNTAPTSLKDYTCTCISDPVTVKTGEPAVCTLDECLKTPCGGDQTCTDPDQKFSVTSDYVCACTADPTNKKTGAQPTCADDECSGTSPCGDKQTCTDPNSSPTSLKDYTCACISDPTTVTTGKPAVCTLDECLQKPCGADQTCTDADQRFSAQMTYECACTADTTIKRTNGQPTCVVDECAGTSPCGDKQTCTDPNTSPTSVNDFNCVCISDPTTSTTGKVAVCTLDECLQKPCGADQTCTDPDQKFSVQLDYECACTADPTIKRTNGQPTCVVDECAGTNPCGDKQTCTDPNTSPTSVNDFNCVCISDPTTSTTGKPAVCTLDECLQKPCGADQTCTDPDQKFSVQLDYECACTADPTIKRTNGQPTCVNDECAGTNPCGDKQTCTDANTSPSAVNDFECKCTDDANVRATGAPAVCVIDECTADPCGTDQTCTDKNTKALSTFDYECVCKTDTATSKTGAKAVCVIDECAVQPCAGQTCADPDKAASKSGDFECTCTTGTLAKAVGVVAVCEVGTVDECAANPSPCGAGQTCTDPTLVAGKSDDYVCTCQVGTGTVVGKPATCVVDECAADPCGNGQDCLDSNKQAGSTDYVCSCRAPATGQNTAKPAVCETDECLANPCTAGQTCTETSKTILGDFRCTCDANGVSVRGGAATCLLDECTPNPCGPGQKCQDPDVNYNAQQDFICTCENDEKRTQQNGSAQCTLDECTLYTCITGQTCTDTNTSIESLQDFYCNCSNGVSAKAENATCALDECASNPCGAGQTCNDPDTRPTVQHDFICTCEDDLVRTQQNGPAQCTLDECTQYSCITGQTCTDTNTSIESLQDFYCNCSNGVSAKAENATCALDECASNPCDAGQTCNDPDTRPTVQHDFICSCPGSDITQQNGPATCGACSVTPPPCGTEQTCTATSNSFTCTCPGGASATGRLAVCGLDECATTPSPCGSLFCTDPNTSNTSLNDVLCCDLAATSNKCPDSVSQLDECTPVNPCGEQLCRDPNGNAVKDYVCSCVENAAVNSTGSPAVCGDVGNAASEEEDTAVTEEVWFWMVILAAALLLCGALGAAVFMHTKKQNNRLAMKDLLDLEEDIDDDTPMSPYSLATTPGPSPASSPPQSFML